MEKDTQTTGAQEDEITLVDVALVLFENARTLVVIPITIGLVALGLSYLVPPSFTATTKILPPQQQQSQSLLLASQLGAVAGMGSVLGSIGLKNPADLYVAMARSRSVADRLLERFKLRELYEVYFEEDARKELASRTRVTAGRDGLIAVEVEDHDPARAADLANAYVDELRRLTQKIAVTEAAQRRLFFEEQLEKVKDELTKSEIALQSSGISEQTIKTLPQSAVQALAQLKAQIAAQQVRLASMRSSMTESNADYKRAQAELLALRAQLAEVERSDHGPTSQSAGAYVARFRDYKYNEALFELMLKQYEAARVDEAREGSVIQVVDVALPPERKSRPRRLLITVAAALTALFLTLIFVFSAYRFRTWATNESPEKVARIRRSLRITRD